MSELTKIVQKSNFRFSDNKLLQAIVKGMCNTEFVENRAKTNKTDWEQRVKCYKTAENLS